MEQKLKKIRGSLGLKKPHRRSRERAYPTYKTKDIENMGNFKTTNPSCKKTRTMGR
jgi:hypothetical protein